MLIAENLSLSYQNKAIISNISISLQPGKISCLIGPNGCGKSTLLRALAGLMKPQSGWVKLDDINLSDWPRRNLARRLALLPQNPSAPDGISVEQLVMHGRYPHQGVFRSYCKTDYDVVDWALLMTDMASLRQRTFNTLSGGERQRGWIALALAQQSPLLILDEPTTYLDIGHQIDILGLLSQLNREHGITIIMVLHDINQACQYADRILVMNEGSIVADDTPLKVVSEQLLARIFGVQTEIIIRQEGERSYPFSLPLQSTRLQPAVMSGINNDGY